MQTSLLTVLSFSRASESAANAPAPNSAPIELSLSDLQHVAGGMAPNGTWSPTATADAPNGTW
jgi:hypothetical protein